MPDPAVLAWLTGRALPLDSLDAGTGTADLAPMRDVWAGTRVIGLGEATHGTHEFFKLKHRLVAFLVAELGVRVIALEASESAAVAVDDYVTYGHGDPALALSGLGFWTWNTGEVLALLKWLRAHNADLELGNRVRFAGVDPQAPAPAADEIETFLAATSPAELPQFAETLAALRHSGMTHPALPESTLHQVEDLAAALGRYTSATPIREHARVRRQAAALVRSARLATAPRDPARGTDSIYALRDKLMAEAVTNLTNTVTNPGPAVAVWAHNGHIQAGQTAGPKSLGSHLRRAFGDEYYALGLVFGSGTFRAKRQRLLRGPTSAPVRHRRGTAPPSTVEGHLARAHPGDHLVDLHDQHAPTAVADWLTTRIFTRQHGAIENHFYRAGFTPTTPGHDYDGLAYIHHTHPSIPC